MRASGGLSNSFAVRPMTSTGKGAPFLVNIEPDHSFGMPLRPPTPIKAVIGNYYGEVAGYHHSQRTENLRQYDEHVRVAMNNPPKGHTRASAMANTFVAGQEQRKKIEPKSLFKMQKFLQVKPRTSTTNKDYVPASRYNRSAQVGRRANQSVAV